MSTFKDLTNQIIELSYSQNGYEHSQIGIVYRQDDLDKLVKLHMMLITGQEWTPSFFKSEISVSLVQVNKDLEVALQEYAKVRQAQIAFQEDFWKKKALHEKNVTLALKEVKEHSGYMTFRDFEEEIDKLFSKKFPSSLFSRKKQYFSLRSLSDDSLTVDHIQDIQKYAKSDEYPFLFREYDDSLCIDESAPGYLEFCQRNAPPIIPSLRDKANTYVSANIGDKGSLSVVRSYEFPLKYGSTKQSFEHLKEFLFGNPSLEEKIKEASSRGSVSDLEPSPSPPER